MIPPPGWPADDGWGSTSTVRKGSHIMHATHTSHDASAKQPAASAKPQAESRDAKGRFAKGNAGGPGNPFARKVAQLRAALVKFVTEDDLKHIVFKVMLMAESGNLEAVKLLFQYVIGKPAAP